MRNATKVSVAALLGVAAFLGAAVATFRHPMPDEQVAVQADPGALLGPAGQAEGLIPTLQERLRDVPGDWQAFAELGLAYVQQARVSSDPAYYPKAEDVLAESLRLAPQDNPAALLGLASLAAARHDFAGAIRFGERARALNPYDGAVYGVIGDALIELGRYSHAFDTFQRMVDTEPGLSSYARVSYARELRGDVVGAIAAMRAAGQVAATPSDRAWVANQLGDLFFNAGRVDDAARAYRAATRIDPTGVPPLAGLAKVAWARGDLTGAIRRMTEVVDLSPLPAYATLLGDLQTVAGDRDAARTQYDLVAAEADLFRANGVNTDLEIAQFQADHGDPVAALAAARAEWRRRHSVDVADAMAWALHRNGRDAKAARYARRALALGTPNATFMAHAGLIQRSLGHRGAARVLLTRALDTNPHFSVLLAPRVRRDLARLVGAA